MCVYCRLNSRLNEKKDSKYIIRKDGKYAMTEDGKKVPKICPECGAEMTLQIKGEPIYICKNDHYFGTMKFSLKEGYEFDSINKNKKSINIYKTVCSEKINKILNDYELITEEDKKFILSLPNAFYKTNDNEIKNLIT